MYQWPNVSAVSEILLDMHTSCHFIELDITPFIHTIHIIKLIEEINLKLCKLKYFMINILLLVAKLLYNYISGHKSTHLSSPKAEGHASMSIP